MFQIFKGLFKYLKHASQCKKYLKTQSFSTEANYAGSLLRYEKT